MIEQGAPAYQRGACLYRAMNGSKCAFGHLIPDSLYHPCFEDGGTGSLLIQGIDNIRYTPKLAASLWEHRVLISKLAKAHDHAAHIHADNFLPHFRQRASEIAGEQGLTFTQGETK